MGSEQVAVGKRSLAINDSEGSELISHLDASDLIQCRNS